MQTSKTDKFVYYFVYFLAFCLAINAEGLTPDYVVGEVEAIQAKSVMLRRMLYDPVLICDLACGRSSS